MLIFISGFGSGPQRKVPVYKEELMSYVAYALNSSAYMLEIYQKESKSPASGRLPLHSIHSIPQTGTSHLASAVCFRSLLASRIRLSRAAPENCEIRII